MSYIMVSIGILLVALASLINTFYLREVDKDLKAEIKKNEALIEKVCEEYSYNREIQETCDWYFNERK